MNGRALEVVSSCSFSVRNELWEMAGLGLPLAVSFFCRMGMASTDSAFVGHIHNGTGKNSIEMVIENDRRHLSIAHWIAPLSRSTSSIKGMERIEKRFC